MKAVSLKQLKDELNNRPNSDLIELCLRLSKFKKENKELLTYLLFEADNESSFIEVVKEETNVQFAEINRKSYFYIRKSIRKILTNIKKHIRYSQNKETEIELLIFFCQKLNSFKPSINNSIQLKNLYDTQLKAIKKKLLLLHEDLQFDYGEEVDKL